MLTARTHTLIQVYIVISLIYVIINVALSYLGRVLERRLNRTRVHRPGHGPPREDEVGMVLPMETAAGGAITVRICPAVSNAAAPCARESGPAA